MTDTPSGTVWKATEASDTASQAVNQPAEQATAEVSAKASDTADAVSEPAQQASTEVLNKASDAADAISTKTTEVSEKASDAVKESSPANNLGDQASAESDSATRVQVVSPDQPDKEGQQAAELAGRATESVRENVPESMGGSSVKTDVAPDSPAGKYVEFIDKLRGKPSQTQTSAGSFSSPASRAAEQIRSLVTPEATQTGTA